MNTIKYLQIKKNIIITMQFNENKQITNCANDNCTDTTNILTIKTQRTKKPIIEYTQRTFIDNDSFNISIESEGIATAS